MRLHHVQVSIPRGGEDRAREFYGGVLGLVEVPKPAALAHRGGCWFRALDGDVVTAEFHLGVDEPFRAPDLAHPALLVDTVDELEAIAARVAVGGYDLSWTDRDTLAGFVRFHCRDGFGNRLEVLARAEA